MDCIYVAPGGGGGGGGRGAVARGGRPRGAGGGIGGTATAAAAATASQELSTSGKTLGASCPGTKYPVQGNPSLRLINMDCMVLVPGVCGLTVHTLSYRLY